jgi:hypothetical protein
MTGEQPLELELSGGATEDEATAVAAALAAVIARNHAVEPPEQQPEDGDHWRKSARPGYKPGWTNKK